MNTLARQCFATWINRFTQAVRVVSTYITIIIWRANEIERDATFSPFHRARVTPFHAPGRRPAAKRSRTIILSCGTSCLRRSRNDRTTFVRTWIYLYVLYPPPYRICIHPQKYENNTSPTRCRCSASVFLHACSRRIVLHAVYPYKWETRPIRTLRPYQ